MQISFTVIVSSLKCWCDIQILGCKLHLKGNALLAVLKSYASSIKILYVRVWSDSNISENRETENIYCDRFHLKKWLCVCINDVLLFPMLDPWSGRSSLSNNDHKRAVKHH